MFNSDQISSTFWFFMGLLVCYFSIPYGIGEIRSPETGFMPFYTGVAICILAGLVFLEATLQGKKGLKWQNPFAKVQWSKPLIVLIALVVYALILSMLGFIPSTALLVGFLLRAIDPQKWLVVILGATLTPLITYMVFQVWLGTNLPAGIFGF
jgi:hypothetical protein